MDDAHRLMDALVQGHHALESTLPDTGRWPANRDLLVARAATHPCGPIAPWSGTDLSAHAALALTTAHQQALAAVIALNAPLVPQGRALEARVWHDGRLSVMVLEEGAYSVAEHGLSPSQACALVRALLSSYARHAA